MLPDTVDRPMQDWWVANGLPAEFLNPSAPAASAGQSFTPTSPGWTGRYDPASQRTFAINPLLNPGTAGYERPIALGNTLSTSGTGPAGGSLAKGSTDRAAILAQISQWAARPGANPSLRNDPNYWADRIMQTGGWDEGYWTGRFMMPEGAPEGASRTGVSTWPNQFTGFGGGDAANFGAPPPPYVSQASTVPSYTTPPIPGELQTPYAPASFTAPTGITMQNDPGYQERIKLADQGLERSAAARGTILSGGFQQAMAEYNQNYASNEYGNVYNRALQGFQTNEGNRLAARQQNQGEFQQNVLGPSQTQYGNQYGAYLNDQSRQLNQYLTNYGVTHTAQNDYWNRLLGLSSQGLQASLGSRLV